MLLVRYLSLLIEPEKQKADGLSGPILFITDPGIESASQEIKML